MKKTIFEEMGGTYIRHGDYLIPCLALPEEEEQRFIGVWGQRHKRYLKEHHGTVKGRKSDGMGGENEQYTDVCKRGCERRIDL